MAERMSEEQVMKWCAEAIGNLSPNQQVRVLKWLSEQGFGAVDPRQTAMFPKPHLVRVK